MSRAIATTRNVGSGSVGYANYEGSSRDSTLERIAEIIAMPARVTSLMSKPREYRKYKRLGSLAQRTSGHLR